MAALTSSMRLGKVSLKKVGSQNMRLCEKKVDAVCPSSSTLGGRGGTYTHTHTHWNLEFSTPKARELGKCTMPQNQTYAAAVSYCKTSLMQFRNFTQVQDNDLYHTHI